MPLTTSAIMWSTLQAAPLTRSPTKSSIAGRPLWQGRHPHLPPRPDSYTGRQTHGRALRQDGWIVLQYWFFYAFNDWRSGFFGANDHEGDWEKISVYLSESETGEVRPEWAAYAAHNYKGDDLRRRWDDPELEKDGMVLDIWTQT